MKFQASLGDNDISDPKFNSAAFVSNASLSDEEYVFTY